MGKWVVLLTVIFSGVYASAEIGDDCSYEQHIIGPWVFNRQFTVGDGCLVQVTPLEKPNLQYREYVFDQWGRMLVFNSTPGQDYATSTAQRNFFLLPVRQAPTLKREGDVMIVTMASGIQVEFGGASILPKSRTPGFELRETGGVDLNPGGGLEITAFPEFLLDTGWALGGRAYLQSEARSGLSYQGGRVCLALNRNLFILKDPFTGEAFYQPRLRCDQSECLQNYLRDACGL